MVSYWRIIVIILCAVYIYSTARPAFFSIFGIVEHPSECEPATIHLSGILFSWLHDMPAASPWLFAGTFTIAIYRVCFQYRPSPQKVLIALNREDTGDPVLRFILRRSYRHTALFCELNMPVGIFSRPWWLPLRLATTSTGEAVIAESWSDWTWKESLQWWQGATQKGLQDWIANMSDASTHTGTVYLVD